MKPEDIRAIVRDEMNTLINSNRIAILNTIRPKIEVNLIEIVKTINQVYYYLNRAIPTLNNFTYGTLEERNKALNTQYIKDTIELFNDGWKADFTNNKQRKYISYFIRKESGWLLYFVNSYFVDGSYLGSGFYCKTEAISKYIAIQFIDIYNIILD